MPPRGGRHRGNGKTERGPQSEAGGAWGHGPRLGDRRQPAGAGGEPNGRPSSPIVPPAAEAGRAAGVEGAEPLRAAPAAGSLDTSWHNSTGSLLPVAYTRAGVLGPSGQKVLDGAPAQLGLDGLADALPPVCDSDPGSAIVAPAELAAATGDRQLWLGQVGIELQPHLLAVAGHHRLKEGEWRGRDRIVTAEWHARRAEGALRRMRTVDQCRSRVMVRRCDDCGHKPSAVDLRCSDWRLCLRCRDKRGVKYRHRFHAARAARRAPKGYRDVMLTLTVPDIGADVDAAMAELRRAWPRFMRRVGQHLELDRDRKGIDGYVRALEVTPGETRQGHPHMHVWLLAPYIPHALLRLYWYRSISERYQRAVPTRPRCEALAGCTPRERAELDSWLVTRRGEHGRPIEEVPWPVLDIRAAYGDSDRIAGELIKYLVKDAEYGRRGQLEYIEPAAYARLYAAYHGCRSISASRGFWITSMKGARPCNRCGLTAWRKEILDRTEYMEAFDAQGTEENERADDGDRPATGRRGPDNRCEARRCRKLARMGRRQQRASRPRECARTRS